MSCNRIYPTSRPYCSGAFYQAFCQLLNVSYWNWYLFSAIVIWRAFFANVPYVCIYENNINVVLCDVYVRSKKDVFVSHNICYYCRCLASIYIVLKDVYIVCILSYIHSWHNYSLIYCYLTWIVHVFEGGNTRLTLSYKSKICIVWEKNEISLPVLWISLVNT